MDLFLDIKKKKKQLKPPYDKKKRKKEIEREKILLEPGIT